MSQARMHTRTHHAAEEHDELHVRVDRQPELLLEGPLRICLDAHGMLQRAAEGEGEGVVRAPSLLLQRRGKGEGVVHAPFLLMQLLLDAKNIETVK